VFAWSKASTTKR